MALNADTLAKKMEACLDQLWLKDKNEHLPQTGKKDRMMLFQAIAQAVVEHLRTNGEVVLTDPKHDHKHGVTCKVDVDTRNELGQLVNHDHKATCTVTIQDHKHAHNKGTIN